MKPKKEEFNPDELVLTKQDILKFCDKVLEKWKKDPQKNNRNIIAMTAVKTSIFWTDEESLKAIWGEILSWTFELMYKNALAHAKIEGTSWSPIIEKLNKNETSSKSEIGMWY